MSMEMDGHPVRSGVPNGSNRSNSSAATNRGGYPGPRVLTVDEALPLTPFTSIVPFNSDIVPIPVVGLRSSVSLYANQEERDQGRRVLDSLNREAVFVSPQNTSRRLQQTLSDLKELLRPDGMTRFTFKTAPKVSTSLSASPELNDQPKMTLSPFAQKVFNQTLVDFSCISTENASSRTAGNRNGSQNHRNSGKSKQIQSQRPHVNQESYTGNSSIEFQLPKQATKAQVVVTPRPSASPIKPSSRFMVVIPSLSDDFKRDEYTPSKHLEKQIKPISKPAILPPSRTSSKSAILSPSRTPLQPAGQRFSPSTPSSISVQIPPQLQFLPNINSQPQTPHQRQPPNSTTARLSSLSTGLAVIIPNLPSTFNPQEYEVIPDSPDTPLNLSKKRHKSEIDGYEEGVSLSIDQREKADTAARNLQEYLQEIFEAEDQLQPDSASLNHFFISTAEGISLTSAAQSKVESLLQKIISMGRYVQAPLDELLRLQKLSEGALKDAETVEVKVDDSMGESEVESWLHQVFNAELGLKAARTSLRVMSGDREEKQLYSEDVIQTALNALKNVLENCIIPIVEMRSTGPYATTFKALSAQKKIINNLLTQCRRVLSLLAALVSKIELSETVINTLEFTASRLIFVENAPFERDSVLGIGKFDSLRVVAMDTLAQIFLGNPAQRQGIFDEILTSLERLPVSKQSARQFKLAEGGSIQLVSALIMRLIQTSASKPDDAKQKRRNKALEALNGNEDDGEPEAKAKDTSNGHFIKSESRAEKQCVTAIQELQAIVTPLLDTAKHNATYVVAFIVNRAMNSTKTGDAPYRNLLDLFVEDFITCLNSTDWPAAELLLRLFLFKMVHLAEGDKTPAPAKNMALDLLGLMGAAISELNSNVRKTANSIESSGDLAAYLTRLAHSSLEKRSSPVDLVSWACGPFRVSLEFLDDRWSADPQLHSAIGFLMAEWASKISTTYVKVKEDDEDYPEIEKEYGRLAYRLRMMITNRRWLSTEYSFETVNPPHARFAYSLTLLHSQFCESFGRVLNILLGSMASEQATVRSKSLKSVNQVLDTDPTILDREPAVKHLILRCSHDSSVQVRDSALTLVGKCIGLRPALEEELIPSILQRLNDSGVGVRKRAMKLSKDIYLRNLNRDVRSSIADGLLHRVNDLDEGVQELARQTIEEVWMSPFYQSTKSDNSSVQFKLAMADHVALILKTVQHSSGVSTVLDKVLQSMLSDSAKFSTANFEVCKSLVATMFETIIDNSAEEGNDAPSARDALQVLMIFAKSNAKLFTPEQVQLLQPYTSNFESEDDYAIFWSVVVIFRHVLPHLSRVHNHFLVAVRNQLIVTVARVGRAILDDLIACLWIISDVLEDYQNLTRLVQSSLLQIEQHKKFDLKDPKKLEYIRKIVRLLRISGMCGKHCDFDPQADSFRQRFPAWKDKSVSKLMADTFAPFSLPSQPLEVREAALDAIGMVCQSWPKNFSSANIYTSFQEVFSEKEPLLEAVVMRAFKGFLLLEEKRSEAGSEALPGAAADPTAKLGVMGGGQGDGIAISIAQRFLESIIRISLSGQDEQALLATEVIASIARQGLVHPKECGPTLIALETSQNSKIADLAFREHRALHEKHETILEKEYMRAVRLAYEYQERVAKDTHGATTNPYTSKLHLLVDVLKISKVKNRKKFFETLCSRMDFDLAKHDTKTLPPHLEFSQFVMENLVFFEYATVDELLCAIKGMENVVTATGTGIAHSIETELFHIGLPQTSQPDENGQQQILVPVINQTRLAFLTAASLLLSGIWNACAFLRKLYGLKLNIRENNGKAAPKDLNRAPVKVAFVTGDKFWEEATSTMDMTSQEQMMRQCRSFVELLTIDEDFKVAAAEGEETQQVVRPSTPSDDEEGESNGPASSSGRSRKRKAVGTPGGRKKRARSSSLSGVKSRTRPKGPGKRAGSIDKSCDDE